MRFFFQAVGERAKITATMIYKFTLSVSGDSLWPNDIIDLIQGNFSVESSFNPDQKCEPRPGTYGFGSISFWHMKKFSTENQIVKYEKSFVDFIYDNHQLFTKNGVEQIDIFMEIYYDGEQCNFEIFNCNLLKQLGEFKVSLPISIYSMKESELSSWEHEINMAWNS